MALPSESYRPSSFWYPGDLRAVSPTPTGRLVGPFIFLSMVYPRSDDGSTIGSLWEAPGDVVGRLSTGSEHRDGREGLIRASVWRAFQQIAEILESVGSSLGEVVRQRIVLSDPADILPAEEVILSSFDGTALPATVYNCEVSNGRANSRILGVEIVASRSGFGDALRRIRLPELEGTCDPYPQAVRVGQLVFTSGVAGGSDLEALNGFEVPPSGRSLSDRTHLALRRQLVECYDHIATVLEHEGTDLRSLLRQTFFTNSDRQAWGFTTVDRRRLFPRPEDFPTSSAFGMAAVVADPSCMVMTDAIALAPGKWKRDATVFEGVTMGHLPMCVAAGPFVFTTGYLGMDKSEHTPVSGFADLSGPERMLGSMRNGGDELVAAQAWHTYRQIVDILNEVGSDASQVVQQTVFMRDTSRFASVEGAARSIFGDDFPATTLIGVDNMGPYPGLDVEIEVIAVRDHWNQTR